MEKSKHSKGESNETNKKPKKTQEDLLNAIQLKSIEKDCLDRVFKLLCELQDQPSSDDDNKQKKYLMEIEKRANQKKMKLAVKDKSSSVSPNSSPLKKEKRYKEDENSKNSSNGNALEETGKRVGVKAVRKILKKLEQEVPKEEMHMMIWEVDENLDGYVSDKEFEKMYKRCIIDEREQEPKRLFYLVQFLMYDKERKGYITEEDTLEILYIRHEDRFTAAIEDIFETKELNERGSIIKRIRSEKLGYLEYAQKMHKLSTLKRKAINDKKKNYCQELLKKLREDIKN